jgi:hypothetical protein
MAFCISCAEYIERITELDRIWPQNFRTTRPTSLSFSSNSCSMCSMFGEFLASWTHHKHAEQWEQPGRMHASMSSSFQEPHPTERVQLGKELEDGTVDQFIDIVVSVEEGKYTVPRIKKQRFCLTLVRWPSFRQSTAISH